MIEDVYPLSPLQQGLLFHQLYALHSGVDIEQIVCTLPKNLNIPVLEKAWQQIIQRHAILRTTFRWLDLDQPQQEVHDRVGLVVNSTSEQDNSPSAELRAGLLYNFLQADRQRGFNLDRPPLMRVHVLRLTDTAYKMIWTFHHILLDGRSFPLILKELFELYESIDQSPPTQAVKHAVRTVELPAPRPYKDYITWLQQQPPNQSENFWRQTLRGFTAPTPLMIDRAATGLSGYDTRLDTLSADNTAALKAFAEQHQMTLNTLVQSAWALVLHRYSGEAEVVFGATRSCRGSALNGAGTDEMIGLFINTLPLRVSVSTDMTVLDFLKDVRRRWTALRDHEHTPLVNVQAWSEIPKHTPLFDSLFVFENYLLQSALQRLGGEWLARDVQLYEQTNYPLTLAAYGDISLLLRIEYDRARFQADAIDRLLGHLQVLLLGFLSHADQPIDTLPLLTKTEQQQLLIEWNNTQRDYPRDRTFQALFEDQVERTPDAKAVIFKNESLTYRELDARANELAATLQSLGVGPDTIVGICIERRLEMMIGLLAILKAGGAYLPIDPAIPSERWQFMLEDARVQIMLTQQRWVDRFIDRCAHAIALDSNWQTHLALSAANPIDLATPDNLAYVIYTSGSTGKPKGTLITHRGLVNYLTWGLEAYNVAQGSGAPVHSSIGFDLTITGLFMPLLTGRSVIMVPEDEEFEGVANIFRRERNLSLVKITPAHLELLAQQLPPAELKDRSNCLVIGGEALHGEALAVWQTHAPNTRLINEYGPTETVVGCCVYEVPQDKLISGPVLIGRPIANTQLYVCDALGRLLPIGVPGELLIGGAGVARGYLNRPELTAEKFVPDRFGADSSARLYRTGDQVRYLADGNLEYLGRLDDQVKIRGYRIEPGEVEAVLAGHPSLRAAAIAVQAAAAQEKRLVAYFVPNEIPAPTENDLREYLRARLPEYMLPAAFVQMKALPLTVNGKIDRRALPAPDLARSKTDQDYIAPRTPIEQRLVEVWGQILGLERVSINANFFELGGHSLAATRLMAKLHQIFKVELPLRDLFETRNIIELAERLNAQQATLLDEIPVSAKADHYPLSFAQARIWFLEQLQPGSATYNIPYALRFNGQLNIEALCDSLNDLVRRHDSLHTVFALIGDQPAQIIQPPQPIELPLIDLRGQSDQAAEIQHLTIDSAERAFDLRHGPLLRAQLLQLADNEYQLLLTLHHIIFDGWSADVFFREWAALYAARVSRAASTLIDLPIQYADFAAWQRERLTGSILDQQLEYWREQLKGELPVLQLPTDHTRPSAPVTPGATYYFNLPKSLHDQLNALSQRTNATLFMLLLAAFQTLLQRYTSQTDLTVGTPIANRQRRELENLIGIFINTLVLRSDLADQPTFRELIKRVRETALGAYANQDVPFEKLVNALQPDRASNSQPLFQVMFVLQQSTFDRIKWPQLKVTSLPLDTHTAKFDLTLTIEEGTHGLSGSIEYRSDLFEANTIERMAGHFQTLLAGLAAQPDQSIATQPLLTATEQHQQLIDWNATHVDYPITVCLHQLVEDQVARTPLDVAVVYENKSLTYSELNRYANQVAQRLQKMNVKPGDRVGICLERSLEMVVAMLGALKAGAAYVPLDPHYPPDRVAYMLADAQVAVLLTQSTVQALLPPGERPLLKLDGDWSELATESPENMTSGVLPEHGAYVIYTSGSTGRPKGVLIPHRAICNHMFWLQENFPLTSADAVLQKTPISFDASVWEFYAPLLAGARLIMAQPEGHLDTRYLIRVINEQQVTTLQLVPTLLQMLLQQDQFKTCSSLRRVFCGGEALPANSVTSFYQLLSADLINLYGPTEAAIDATYWPCPRDAAGSIIPIGRPVANTQAYLLDQNLQPVPIGVPGELYLGGAGLAIGYLNQPVLTAEKFIANPFSQETGSRLYKTGDLTRYRRDGAIEYLGRLDHQIKLRGFRIELGEIEAAISQHPSVQETAVIITDDQRLVAYLALHSNLALTVSDLRNFLKSRLPAYMLPTSFTFLERLPLTPNGKVDRKGLPAPEAARPELDQAYVAPRNPIEQVLADLWKEVLGIEHIGIHDNFFELGGHSLLATQLIARLQRVFRVELPLRSFFDSPSVAELAEQLVAHGSKPGQVLAAARIQEKLNQMTPAEIEALLAKKKQQQTTEGAR